MKKALDWSNYHDQGMGDAYADIPKHGGNFAKAVSVCIRSGVCQQPDNKGVMCPSFRVTGDPKLSPGGRVQLLKTVLNQSEDAMLSDHSLATSLEHCVSCKGCKRDCENSLDMAAIKAEYLAQKRRSGHRSLRQWLFAEFPYLAYRYPSLRHMIAFRNRSSILKRVGAKLLNINPNIDLPLPAKAPYQDSRLQAQRNHSATPKRLDSRGVVLLIDSFTALFHPHIVTDALKVLHAAHYHVITLHPTSQSNAPILDSGRSLFSQGYTGRTTKQARALIDKLQPYLALNYRVVGLEPSTLLMLRDEFLMLNLGEQAKTLAQNTLLFEEFVARESHVGRLALDFTPSEGQQVMVHGHCHQKAVGALKSMRKVLRLIPNLKFEFIQASCCGMAGSYGLEAEHHELSRKMAQLELLPALNAHPDATIVCNGFSCSEQIYALTERKPLHLATLLARHLVHQ